MRRRRTTMKDVAGLAGVGLATVSRVVNETGQVSPEKTKLVQNAIKELGFQPDDVARSLRPGQVSRLIGLKVGDLTNPFWSHLCKGAIEVAEESGYAVILGSSDEDPEVERRTIRDLLARRVAGLVVAPDASGNIGLLEENTHPSVPVVFVDRPSRDMNGDYAVLDNFGGGRKATASLIGAGHTRIGIVVAPSYYATGLRLRGYRRAMENAGIPIDESNVIRLLEGSSEEACRAITNRMTEPNPPTAFFCTTNFMTKGALQALGTDLSGLALVGFDDFDYADQLPIPISVIADDPQELGRRAISMLLTRINGSQEPPRREVLPVVLIERSSGRIPPKTM